MKAIPGSQGLGCGAEWPGRVGDLGAPPARASSPHLHLAPSSEPGAGAAFPELTQRHQPLLSTGLPPGSQPDLRLSAAGPS